MSSTGIAVGLKKGFPTTKRTLTAKPSHAKGVRIIIIVFVKTALYYFDAFYIL